MYICTVIRSDLWKGSALRLLQAHCRSWRPHVREKSSRPGCASITFSSWRPSQNEKLHPFLLIEVACSWDLFVHLRASSPATPLITKPSLPGARLQGNPLKSWQKRPRIG